MQSLPMNYVVGPDPKDSMTSVTFPSKVDTWLALALLAGVGAAIVGVLAAGGILPWPVAFFALALGCVLPVWLLVSTGYTLTDEQLVVKAGPFRWRVPIGEIKSVTPTRSALSSPALSLDRLRIEYGDSRSILVSPKNREDFLLELEARRTRAV
jgi:FtsH-binding integral membrane protein